MQDFLQRLQDSDFSVWVSTAPTLLAYPTILLLHTVGLAMIVGPNAIMDLRLLGFGRGVPLGELQKGFRIMWVGLFINASTGITLFVSEAAEKGTKWIFFVKLATIAVAFVVALRMRRLMATMIAAEGAKVGAASAAGNIGAALDDTGGSAPSEVIPARAKVLAVASLVLWVGAITAGRLMAYIK